MVSTASTIYVTRRIDEKYIEIASFEDGSKESISVYKVYKGKTGIYICDCPGYWRQKTKEDHKHSRIVKFWIEHLNEEPGYCFLLEDNDTSIEFNKFLDKERLEKWLIQKDIQI